GGRGGGGGGGGEEGSTRGGAPGARGFGRARRDGSRVLAGGDLPGRRGGNDLGAPGALADLSVSVPGPAQRPLRLVFDPWKAWPKPAAFQFTGAPADVSASPKDNLAEVE